MPCRSGRGRLAGGSARLPATSRAEQLERLGTALLGLTEWPRPEGQLLGPYATPAESLARSVPVLVAGDRRERRVNLYGQVADMR